MFVYLLGETEMVKVLEVRAGGLLVVDGSELYRTFVGESVIEELLPYHVAVASVMAYNEVVRCDTCEMASYSDLAQMASI